MHRLIAFLFLCTAIISLSNAAHACSCTVDAFSAQGSKQHIAKAAYIAEGNVSFIAPYSYAPEGVRDNGKKPSENPAYVGFGITVSNLMKGKSETKLLTAYAPIATTCGTSKENLKRQTFFVLYESKNAELILANDCTAYIAPQDRIALMRKRYKP